MKHKMLEQEDPVAAAKFKQLFHKPDMSDKQLEHDRTFFWLVWCVARNGIPQFSQDEVNFVKAETTGSDDWDSWGGVIKEMEKNVVG